MLVINKPDIPWTKRINLDVGSRMVQQVIYIQQVYIQQVYIQQVIYIQPHTVVENARSQGIDSVQPGPPLLKGREISAQM